MKPRHQTSEKRESNKQDRGKTNPPGQNPRQDDSTTQDVYHDETRENLFDPELAKQLNPKKKKK
jgi:hypothetical protein